MKIAKPLLLVSTPVGVLIGLYEAWRLAHAMFAMTSGPDPSGRVVRALSIRVGLSPSTVTFSRILLEDMHFHCTSAEGFRTDPVKKFPRNRL